jgi:auxin efflux carrier family
LKWNSIAEKRAAFFLFARGEGFLPLLRFLWFWDAGGARTYDEYTREDFSFGNRNDLKLEDIDKDGPRLDNKFGSTSTAELTPKLPEDEAAKGMPPSTVMIKLIAVMTFRKLVWNPNTYSSLLGVIWSLVAFR